MTLTLEEVAVERGGLRLLEGVSFRLDPGEALILRGANGTGKTSLLRVVAGLAPPARGRIDGAAERVAYAAHADGLKATLTVAENLTFWARVFGTSEIASALEAFDLAHFADRAAQHLSAGQKRRLGLARLLVAQRPLWVLDEPTVSLDADSVARFAGVLQRHLEVGGSALIATHIDLAVAAREVELSKFRPASQPSGAFDEAFA